MPGRPSDAPSLGLAVSTALAAVLELIAPAREVASPAAGIATALGFLAALALSVRRALNRKQFWSRSGSPPAGAGA